MEHCTLGPAVLKALQRKGWTQVQLARRIPCDKSVISQWIRGHRPISIHHAQRMVELFDDVEFSFAVAEWATFGQVGTLFGGIQGGRAGAAMSVQREMHELRDALEDGIEAILQPGTDKTKVTAINTCVNLSELMSVCAELLRRISGEYGFGAHEVQNAFRPRVRDKGYVVDVELRRAA